MTYTLLRSIETNQHLSTAKLAEMHQVTPQWIRECQAINKARHQSPALDTALSQEEISISAAITAYRTYGETFTEVFDEIYERPRLPGAKITARTIEEHILSCERIFDVPGFHAILQEQSAAKATIKAEAQQETGDVNDNESYCGLQLGKLLARIEEIQSIWNTLNPTFQQGQVHPGLLGAGDYQRLNELIRGNPNL